MFIRAELTFDARTFRHALGRFPTGVCVLTSVVEGVPLGNDCKLIQFLVAQSAACLVQHWWACRKPSLLDEGGGLRPERAGRKPAGNVRAVRQADLEQMGGNKLLEWPFRRPVLPGIAALFECAAESAREAGDHLLFIGAVRRYCSFVDRPPLVFHGGQYGRLHCSQSSSTDTQPACDGLRIQGEEVDTRQGRAALVVEVE